MHRSLKERFKRDELRQIWEQKCLSPSVAAIEARTRRAASRLRMKGNTDPSMREIERERFALEEERFSVWYAEKRLNGFDRV